MYYSNEMFPEISSLIIILYMKQKEKSTQTGIPSLFETLVTHCLTSALITIHEPLIFVTKSIRLTHFRGKTKKSIHTEQGKLSSVSRHLSYNHLMMALLHKHTHTHTQFSLYIWQFLSKQLGASGNQKSMCVCISTWVGSLSNHSEAGDR